MSPRNNRSKKLKEIPERCKIRSESAEEDDSLPIGSAKQYPIEDDRLKCGEIFLSRSTSSFTFACAFCKRELVSIDDFGHHWQDNHADSYMKEEENGEIYFEEILLKPAVEFTYFVPGDDHVDIKTEEENASPPPSVAAFEGTGVESRTSNDTQSNTETNKSKQTEKPNSNLYCSICTRQFSSQSSYRSHQKLHVIPKDLKCQFCEKICTDGADYNEHMKMHDKKTNRYKCQYCNQNFQTRFTRQRHESTHKAKWFKCSQCSRAFRSEFYLASHEKGHMAEKNFECDICGRRFRLVATLNDHRLQHTGEKPFQCEECGLKFPTKRRLNNHRLRHDEKQFKCNVCDKRFFTNALLQSHNITHSNDRPFVCDICGKSFQRRSHYRRHQEIHSDEKSHVCTVCGKAFKVGDVLRQHIRSHHRDMCSKLADRRLIPCFNETTDI